MMAYSRSIDITRRRAATTRGDFLGVRRGPRRAPQRAALPASLLASSTSEKAEKDAERKERKGGPVLIVPGFLSGADKYLGMADELRRLDVFDAVAIVPLTAADWYPTLAGGDFRDIMDKIEAAARRFPSSSSSSSSSPGKLLVVGHSAGGWLARCWMGSQPYSGGVVYAGGSRVDTLLTLVGRESKTISRHEHFCSDDRGCIVRFSNASRTQSFKIKNNPKTDEEVLFQADIASSSATPRRAEPAGNKKNILRPGHAPLQPRGVPLRPRARSPTGRTPG